jgi:hypothetical protein
VRAHRAALQAQRALWHALLHDEVAFRTLQACLGALRRAEAAATRAYRRCARGQ